MRQLVLPILVFAITASTEAAGYMLTCSSLLVAGLSLFGGVIVDRIDRRYSMLMRAGIGGVIWAIVALLVGFNGINYWLLFILVLGASATEGLFSTADDAALRSIVPNDADFGSAQSINQGRQATIMLAGGPLGGLFYGVATWSPFAITTALLALLALAAWSIKTDLHPRAQRRATVAASDVTEIDVATELVAAVPTAETETTEGDSDNIAKLGMVRGIFADISEGLSLIWRSPTKRIVALSAMVVNTALTLIVTSVNLNLVQAGYSAFSIAILDSVFAVGMIVGSVLSSLMVKKFPTGHLLVAASFLVGVETMLLAIWHDYSILFLWFSLFGLLLPLLNAPASSYFFATTPSHIQGRASSAMTVLAMGTASFSPAIAGWCVHNGWTAVSIGIGAAGSFGMFIFFFASTAIRNIGKPDTWAEYEAALPR